MPTKSHSEELKNHKWSTIGHYGASDISQAALNYRKEEILKKKLKKMLDLNAELERDIKVHQSEIKDQRASIAFQLHDLTKQMTLKFQYFTQEKLQKSAFHGNQASHVVLQQMMSKYQRIQKECVIMRRIFDSLQTINEGYKSHARQMQQLVLSQEANNQQYEEQKQKTLDKIRTDIWNIDQQIKDKQKIIINLDDTTQELIRQIDMFIKQKQIFKQEQNKALAKIQYLKDTVCKQQKKVEKIKQWAEIVIDKNNRTIVFKNIKQKKEYLDRLKNKNNQLEIYLCQLQNEQELLRRQAEVGQKENRHIQRPKPDKKGKQKKEKQSFKLKQPSK